MGVLQVRIWWTAHRRAVMLGAVVVMVALAAMWLAYETYRLYWQPERIGGVAIHPGAIDLRIFHAFNTAWFSGGELFTGRNAPHAVYPPATMVLFWPVYGWTRLPAATIAWSVTAAAALAWLLYQFVVESGADTPLERAFVALVPLATYPVGAIIGNGQVTLQLLPALVASVLLLRDRVPSWGRDLAVAALFVVALAKPTIATPFFWIVVFTAGTLRPALLIVVAYAALTLLAASFRDESLFDLLRQLSAQSERLVTRFGHAHLPRLLGQWNIGAWHGLASLVAVALLGLWVLRFRRADRWLLLGVAALVARFAFYHRWYDDVLVLLPLLALFRIARDGNGRRDLDLLAGALFTATLLLMLAPGGVYALPPPWNDLWVNVATTVWIADLAFLVYVARHDRAAGSPCKSIGLRLAPPAAAARNRGARPRA
jgi:hypothetical protein